MEWQQLTSRFLGGLPMSFDEFLSLSIVSRFAHLRAMDELVEDYNEAANAGGATEG